MKRQQKENSVLDLQIASKKHPKNKRLAIFLGLVAVIGLIVLAIDFAPNLSHMNLRMLSGPATEPSYAIVEKLAKQAVKHKGNLKNISTTGIEDNINQLAEDVSSQEALFTVVPAGIDYSATKKMQLVAQLPVSNSIFFLGRDADRIHHLSDLKEMHIGIGPKGSSTALIAQQLLAKEDLSGLKLKFSSFEFEQQIHKLLNNELDIGVFLTSENNLQINKAIKQGLKVVSFMNSEAWVARNPGLQVETLYSGYYDQVALLPKSDKKVFKVEHVVVANQHASRSDIVALLVLLNNTFHDFVDYNQKTPNETGIIKSSVLVDFIKNGGPNLLDEYAPRLVSFMPPANLLHYLVLISVLMNLMTGWNKLRLYFVDSKRIDLENQLHQLIGTKLTLDEINKLNQSEIAKVERHRLNELKDQYELLLQRCKKYAVSFVTPMGQENVYRYHEGLIAQQLKIIHEISEVSLD